MYDSTTVMYYFTTVLETWRVREESMTCNVGTAQTCHTCLIWHQGLHQRLSEIFDLSEDTFIVLFAKLSFQSRF